MPRPAHVWDGRGPQAPTQAPPPSHPTGLSRWAAARGRGLRRARRRVLIAHQSAARRGHVLRTWRGRRQQRSPVIVSTQGCCRDPARRAARTRAWHPDAMSWRPGRARGQRWRRRAAGYRGLTGVRRGGDVAHRGGAGGQEGDEGELGEHGGCAEARRGGVPGATRARVSGPGGGGGGPGLRHGPAAAQSSATPAGAAHCGASRALAPEAVAAAGRRRPGGR